jgi:uncharacterized protein YoxC
MASLLERIEILEGEKKSLETTLRARQETLHIFESQVGSLSKQCSDLEQERTLLQDTVEQFRHQITLLTERMAQMTSTLHDYERTLDRKTDDLNAAGSRDGHFDSMRQRVLAIEEEKAKLEQDFGTLANEKQLKDGEVVLVKMQLEQMMAKLSEKTNENVALLVSLRDLESRSENAKEALKMELSETLKRFADYETTTTSLYAVNEELKMNLESARREQHKLLLDIGKIEADRTSIQKDADAGRMRQASLERMVEQLRQTIADLEARAVPQHDTEKRLIELQSEKAKLLAALTTLESDLNETRVRLTEALSTIEQLRRQQEERQRQPLRVSDLDLPEALRASDRAMGDVKLQSILVSMSDVTVPEIITHYEKKIQTLHVLLEKGERALMSAESMVNRDKRRSRKSKRPETASVQDKENMAAVM